jgi:hypothetical protein
MTDESEATVGIGYVAVLAYFSARNFNCFLEMSFLDF